MLRLFIGAYSKSRITTINYYPVNLNLENKKCVVVGAGRVAERKIRRLLECGARILAISPAITPFLKSLAKKKKIIFKHRRVNAADLKGAYLVISATGDRGINTLVSSYCHGKNILVNVVDSPKECSFILPSIVRRGGLTIAISTDGLSPALSKQIRQDLEQKFGAEYAKLLRMMKKLRPEALQKIKSSKSRKIFFQKAVQREILNLLKEGKGNLASQRVRGILEDANT